MSTYVNKVANTLTTNFVPVQATFDTSGNFLTFIGPGGVAFTTGGGSMVYPGVGIPNSTGSAWGTSYGVSGTGSVALTSNPIFSTNITVNSISIGRATGNNNIRNTFINSAGAYVDGINNTAVGQSALLNSGISALTGDDNNAAFGWQALAGLDNGAENTGIGSKAGNGMQNGNDNVFVGYNAQANPISATSGITNSTYIGANVSGSLGGTYNNETVIGSNAVGNGDNTVTIGDANVTSTYLKGNVYAPSGIYSGTVLSADNNAGGVTIGLTSSNQTMTFGRSVAAQIINIATGIAGTVTKTVNIGTNSGSTSTTNIAIGSTAGTSTTTIQGYFKPPALSSAPTYVKGAVYFDTTLNKLRVGGATAWETITSV